MSFLAQFHTIDVSAPWLEPYRNIHHAFCDDGVDTKIADWLNDFFTGQYIANHLHQSDRRLEFVSQDDLPHGTAYEAHIHKTARIPTRDNLHDWFGACVWSAFGRSKSVLNHVHITQMKQDSQSNQPNQPNQRNRVRDAVTVFDENGVILAASRSQIGESLRAFDWQNALVAPRQHWQGGDDKTQAQAFIFGHALLEQLIQPRKPLCGHTLIVAVDDAFFKLSLSDKLAHLDRQASQMLLAWLTDGATPRDLSPLPILGVPYFWQDNQDVAFYDDEFVFRQGRRAK